MVSVGGIDLYIVQVQYTLIFKLSQERFCGPILKNAARSGLAAENAEINYFK